MVLEYVLNTFCHDDDDDNILSKSLTHEGVKDIEDLYLYKDADFDQFQYVSDSTTKQQDTIRRGQAGKLRMIKGFFAYKSFLDEDLTTKELWMAVTKEEFDEFRVSTTWFGMVNRCTNMLTPTCTSSVNNRVPDPVADFKKGIKRDITVFPILKLDEQFEAWNRSMLTHARAQNVDDILNPSYKALAPDTA